MDFHSENNGKPFQVVKQGSDIISIVIYKSFPTLLAVWKITGEQGTSGRKETRKEGFGVL